MTTLTVNPTTIAIAPYEPVALTATARDGGNQVIPTAVVTWSSSAPAIAAVSPSSPLGATVTPLFDGSATITARDVRASAPAVTIPVTVRICVDPLVATSTAVPHGGESSSFTVSATAACTWRGVSLAPWLTVTAGASAAGNGTVTFAAAANDTFFTRTGFIAAGGRLFSVTQPPQPNQCVQGLSPGQTQFTAAGGDGDFGLSADPNCTWQEVSSEPGWLIPLNGFGQGSASPRFRVLPNDTPWQRSATIGVVGGGITITQAGAEGPPSPPPAPAPLLVGGTVQYYHSDAIGSVRMITNQSGVRIERYDYTPFGVQWGAGSLTPPDPRRFTGAERDTETNQDYFGARYYQSQTARFTSPDIPGVDHDPFDPQSWNLYTYVRNNPLRFIDPTGRQCENGYDPDKGVFCTEVVGKNPYTRPEEAWQIAQQFFFDRLFNRLLTSDIANISAGVGDALTGRMIPGVDTSLTEYVRNKSGTDSVVAKDTVTYRAGNLTGGTVGWALVGSASATAAAIANGKYGALFGRGGKALFNHGPVRFGWYWHGPAATGRDVIGLRIGAARGTKWWSHIPFWYP